MRVLEAFESEGHAPYLGNRSHWGDAAAEEVDFLRDPDGPGWHLDRQKFERFLRAQAQDRGARLAAPAKLRRVAREGARWLLTLDTDIGRREVAAQILVDGGGRAAPIARRLGIRRRNTGRLIAVWLRGTVTREGSGTAGFSHVESEPCGWWYTAPISGRCGRPARILAFHTDSDLAAPLDRDPTALLNRARRLPGLGGILDWTGFAAEGPARIAAANSAVLEQAAGDRWIAIGDAALSVDPLALRGLFNALYTAMTGAVACHEVLEGALDALARYSADLARVSLSYENNLARIYAAERRWPTYDFWARRAV